MSLCDAGEAAIRREDDIAGRLRKLSHAVEQSPAATLITDTEGRIEYVNPKFTQVSGYTLAELLGKTPAVIKSGNTPPQVYEALWKSIRAGHEWRGEMQNRRKNGELYWESEVISPLKNERGEVVNFIAVKEDITERKRAEAELLRMNRTLRMISECNEALVMSKGEQELLESICRIVVRTGGHAFAWVGFAEDERGARIVPVATAGAPGRNFDDVLGLVTWGDEATGEAPAGIAIRTGAVFDARDILTNPRYRPWQQVWRKHAVCAAIALPLRSAGRAFGALTIYAAETDAFNADEAKLLAEMSEDLAYGITSLRTAEEHRKAAEAMRLRDRAIESSINGIMISDSSLPDHPIVYVNPAFERITGYAAHEVIGRNGRFLVRDDMGQIGLAEARTALREGRSAQIVIRSFRKDGSVFWNELSIAPVRDDAGRMTHVVSIIDDVTDRVRYEEELAHQANHDSLTGLANRNLLMDRLDQAIASARRYGRAMAVVYLDLDHFKVINDSLGHRAGDELIKAVSRRLAGCLRGVDTLARVGGDEYVLLLSDVADGDQAALTLQRVQESMAAPFQIDGHHELYVSCSMGASLFPRDGHDGQTLLKNADVAMYRVKEQGRNHFRFFTAEMNVAVSARLAMANGLRRGLERGEFVLHYQPLVDLGSGRICGAEALARWKHPELGLLEAGEFIPTAEETGLIVPIGQWVLDAACAQNAQWQREGLPRIVVAVNLSARQFHQENLAATVQETLRRHGLQPPWLELELTESMLMRNVAAAVAALRSLSELGICLALDDFGTGYSSLSYLKRFPFNKLKIDQSFVRDVTRQADDAAIVSAIIAMAKSLNLRVIAEGVETREQLAHLQRQHCDCVQGHYLSKPVPADQLAELLRSGKTLA